MADGCVMHLDGDGGAIKNSVCGLWTPHVPILNSDQVLRKSFMSLDSHKTGSHEEKEVAD